MLIICGTGAALRSSYLLFISLFLAETDRENVPKRLSADRSEVPVQRVIPPLCCELEQHLSMLGPEADERSFARVILSSVGGGRSMDEVVPACDRVHRVSHCDLGSERGLGSEGERLTDVDGLVEPLVVLTRVVVPAECREVSLSSPNQSSHRQLRKGRTHLDEKRVPLALAMKRLLELRITVYALVSCLPSPSSKKRRTNRTSLVPRRPLH